MPLQSALPVWRKATGKVLVLPVNLAVLDHLALLEEKTGDLPPDSSRIKCHMGLEKTVSSVTGLRRWRHTLCHVSPQLSSEVILVTGTVRANMASHVHGLLSRWPHHAGQRDEGSVRLWSSGASLLLVTLLCGCKLFFFKSAFSACSQIHPDSPRLSQREC